jgi:hypothetical protein
MGRKRVLALWDTVLANSIERPSGQEHPDTSASPHNRITVIHVHVVLLLYPGNPITM